MGNDIISGSAWLPEDGTGCVKLFLGGKEASHLFSLGTHGGLGYLGLPLNFIRGTEGIVPDPGQKIDPERNSNPRSHPPRRLTCVDILHLFIGIWVQVKFPKPEVNKFSYHLCFEDPSKTPSNKIRKSAEHADFFPTGPPVWTSLGFNLRDLEKWWVGGNVGGWSFN